MKKFWIVTELFYPDETSTSYILTKIANALSSKYNVNVVTGEVSSASRISSSLNLSNQVQVARVKSIKEDKSSILKRSIRLMHLSFSICMKLLINVHKGEKVFSVTNPQPLLILLAIFKRLKKFHWTLLVHDVFPENAVAAGIISNEKGLKYRLIKKLFDFGYRSADQLIVLGRDMDDVVRSKVGPNCEIIVIENWAEDQILEYHTNSSIDFQKKNKPIVFQYAGNVGRVQGLQEIIELANRIDNPSVSFQIVGDGPVKDELVKYVEDNDMRNVSFSGSFPRNQQIEILEQADISIISLGKDMYGLGVPSKTYNIMAAGKPILFIGPSNSEIDRVVNESRIGFSFNPNNKCDLEKFFNDFKIDRTELELMGERARTLVKSHYTEEIILKKFMKVL